MTQPTKFSKETKKPNNEIKKGLKQVPPTLHGLANSISDLATFLHLTATIIEKQLATINPNSLTGNSQDITKKPTR